MTRQREDVRGAVRGLGNYYLDESIRRQVYVPPPEWRNKTEGSRKECVRKMFEVYGREGGRGRRQRAEGAGSRTASQVSQSADGESFTTAQSGVRKKPGMKGGVASQRTRPRGKGGRRK